MIRILRDAAPADGGGGNPSPAPAPAPAAAPQQQQPPAAPAQQPANPAKVEVPWDQFQVYQQAAVTLAEVRAAQAQAEREKLQAQADKQAAEGKWREASETMRSTHAAELKEREGRALEWEGRAKSYARDREIMADLQARGNLQPGAAEKILKLYGDRLQAHPEGAGFAVRTDTFQGVKDYFDAVLADPSNAFFLRPSTTGGAGAAGGGTPPPAAPADESRLTEAERATLAWQRARMQQYESAYGPAR